MITDFGRNSFVTWTAEDLRKEREAEIQMREIKFRAWHKGQKEMWSPEMMTEYQFTLMPDGSGFINVSGKSVKLSKKLPLLIPMQFTGLKDKSGTEIYGGDLVQETFEIKKGEIKGYIQQVIWIEKDTCFGLKPSTPYEYTRLQYSDNREVIGNIFQNKGLLNDSERTETN